MSQALLLAEAEPGTREFLARHLASDGFAVLGADAGREALELVERERPDLVLVGGLPDAPALEVCRVLREGEPGRSWDRDVPVIVLGEARADAVDRVHAFERGCDDFVPRPFHYEELVARIHAVLRRTQPGIRERLAAGPLAVDRATRTRDRARPDGRALGEGVRAAGQARHAAHARLHQGGAAARRLGLPVARAHAHARLARLAPAPQARAGRCRGLRAQRVGRRLPADRRLRGGSQHARRSNR